MDAKDKFEEKASRSGSSRKRASLKPQGAHQPIGDGESPSLPPKPFVNLRFKSFASFLFPAEDGALLGKIEKVRVLRNDRREGKTSLNSILKQLNSDFS